MSRRPKSKTQQAIEAINARVVRGELTAEQAAEQVAAVRREHYQAVYRALLDSAAALQTSELVQPGAFGEVQVRLTGARHDVGGALALLDQVTDLGLVSNPYPHESGVRVYASMSRRSPLVGGVK